MFEIGWLAERPVVGGKQTLNHSTSLCNRTDRAIVYAVTALKTGTELIRVCRWFGSRQCSLFLIADLSSSPVRSTVSGRLLMENEMLRGGMPLWSGDVSNNVGGFAGKLRLPLRRLSDVEWKCLRAARHAI